MGIWRVARSYGRYFASFKGEEREHVDYIVVEEALSYTDAEAKAEVWTKIARVMES